MPDEILNTNEHNENAILTIRSTQCADDETEQSELNTTARYSSDGNEIRIEYTELDENGKEVGQTVITILEQNLVTIHKLGFAEAVMILEKGKTHPVKYSTMFGDLEMMLCALEIRSQFHPGGGKLLLRYMIDIGDSYSATNTIDLRVRLR